MYTQHSSLLYTLGGIALFMYGMSLASDNLQKLASNRIRDLIAKLSQKPLWGVGAGIILTVLIQSSGAVTSMLVGLGTAGVINLAQVMSVIIGTAVGTTVTVQLLSLDIAQYGLPIFTFSFGVYFITEKRNLKRVMAVVMGFGLIFWGLELIGVGTNSIRQLDLFADFLGYLKANPLVTIAATSVFTAIVHSSAVTIGFSMALAASGQITLYESMFWVYGANIGTTATALLASMGGNYVGKQVAWAHCFYKLVSVLIFYFFTDLFIQIIPGETIQRSIANAHTLYNLLAALVFFPFIKYGSRLMELLFPPTSAEKEYSVKFLDRSHFQSPEVVLAHAEREILRMGDLVFQMTQDSISLLKNENPDLFHKIREMDNRVDMLNREISLFLTQYIDENEQIPQEQIFRLISFASDLESAADVIDNNLTDLSQKKHNLKLEFSDAGWKDLVKIHKQALKIIQLSLSCFQTNDTALASKVIYYKREMRKLEKDMRRKHIERLVEGLKETINTSAIHLDVLGEYRRIGGLLSNHVYSLLKESDKYNILPRRDPE